MEFILFLMLFAFIGIAYYCRYKKNYKPVQSLSMGCLCIMGLFLLLSLLGGVLSFVANLF